jgi:hypothetical protein
MMKSHHWRITGRATIALIEGKIFLPLGGSPRKVWPRFFHGMFPLHDELQWPTLPINTAKNPEKRPKNAY